MCQVRVNRDDRDGEMCQERVKGMTERDLQGKR